MTYEIRVYYQMLYGDGEDYYSIADADIINIDLGYSGNSNIDPFEFIGNRASVLVAANARTAFLDTLYTNDIGFEHIVRILNADTNTPIFTGMILFNGYNHNYKTDTYSFEVSDALDVWITKAKQIEVSAGSNSYLLGFFAQALAPYGDLNRWEWDNTYDDVRLTTVPYSRGFPTADFVYVPFIWIDPSGNNYSGIGEDVFDDDEDFTNWRVVSRQCHVQENRITYFVILREFPFNYLNIHMRVVYYTLKIDEDRLIQIMDTGKRGVIRPTQSSNQSAVHNYIKAQLIAAEALPSDVTYANVYATEYQGLEGSPNQGDAIYSLIPKFDTDQDYLYPSGEHIWVDKWGGSTALLNLAKPNLLTKDGTLAEIVKGFCILLGIGMTSLTDGGSIIHKPLVFATRILVNRLIVVKQVESDFFQSDLRPVHVDFLRHNARADFTENRSREGIECAIFVFDPVRGFRHDSGLEQSRAFDQIHYDGDLIYSDAPCSSEGLKVC